MRHFSLSYLSVSSTADGCRYLYLILPCRSTLAVDANLDLSVAPDILVCDHAMIKGRCLKTCSSKKATGNSELCMAALRPNCGISTDRPHRVLTQVRLRNRTSDLSILARRQMHKQRLLIPNNMRSLIQPILRSAIRELQIEVPEKVGDYQAHFVIGEAKVRVHTLVSIVACDQDDKVKLTSYQGNSSVQ